MVDLPKVRYLKATSTQGPHSHILMTGAPTEVHILYPKNPNFRIILSTQKVPTFFSIPKKIPQCFCISKFYYLPSGKLKHANFNFGFGQKQNYTKTNTKSTYDCYSVSSSYLLRQLYRKIFIMTSAGAHTLMRELTSKGFRTSTVSTMD